MKLKRVHFLFLGASFGILVLYFILRLTNILSLPLFTDEAIYIRWAQIARQDASWRFISLVDGKQPSFVWIAMILLRFFEDPLLAGRMVSVIAGLFTTIGLFFLGNEVFKERKEKIFDFTKKSVSTGLLSSFIYVVYPFGLVYDRMALYDSLVAAFAVWSLYLLILLVRTLRLDVALIAGLVIGGGLLTKSNAFFSLGSIPFLFAIFSWEKRGLKPRFIKLIFLLIVVLFLSNALYAILRLSPFYHVIAEKTALFAYPVSEWIKHPFTYFGSNLRALFNWFITYFGILMLVLVMVSLLIKRERFWEKIVLMLWFLFPFIYLAFFGNTIYPRFILFMTVSLIPLAAYSIHFLLERYRNFFVKLVIFIFAFSIYFYSDFKIITDFARAPIPERDLNQLINGWSAGNGVGQSVKFFEEQAKDRKIYIVTEGTFGLLPYGLEMYLDNNPNVKIEAIWPIKENIPEGIAKKAKNMPVFAVFYQPCPPCKTAGDIPLLWRSNLLFKYRQGISNDYYSVYQILP